MGNRGALGGTGHGRQWPHPGKGESNVSQVCLHFFTLASYHPHLLPPPAGRPSPGVPPGCRKLLQKACPPKRREGSAADVAGIREPRSALCLADGRGSRELQPEACGLASRRSFPPGCPEPGLGPGQPSSLVSALDFEKTPGGGQCLTQGNE